MSIKFYVDGANLAQIATMAERSIVHGFTTNPTLMRKAGVTDYEEFAEEAVAVARGKPISFEVCSDDWTEMQRQALKIASWGENVYVKVPITNTRGESSGGLISRLSVDLKVQVNVTAVMSLPQVHRARQALMGGAPSNVSIFAGRIADTGRDPVPIVKEALATLASEPQVEVIWASPREALNVYQADDVGCHIITATSDILAKLSLYGKSLDVHSLDTVRMFYDDARAAGYAF